MTRAKIARKIRVEEAREGLLCLWLAHTYGKSRNALRRSRKYHIATGLLRP